jgi:uncharacterized protein YdeI (YjbR/CyaY-like superfamily)
MDDVKNILNESQLWDTFEKLSPSHKKEYLKWIDEAKKTETRTKRIYKMAYMLKEKKKNQ